MKNVTYRIDGMIWVVRPGSIGEGMALYAARNAAKAHKLVTLADVPWQVWQEV